MTVIFTRDQEEYTYSNVDQFWWESDKTIFHFFTKRGGSRKIVDWRKRVFKETKFRINTTCTISMEHINEFVILDDNFLNGKF